MLLHKKKYLYLDWNVIQYMKSHRKNGSEIDEYFSAKIMELLKKGKYIIPYSEGHIKDVANKYKSEYRDIVLKELKFFSRLNKSICLGKSCSSEKLSYEIKDMREFFDGYISQPKNELSISDVYNADIHMNVDLDSLDQQHPLRRLAEKNCNITPYDMAEFLVNLYREIFSSSEEYKRLRNYPPNVDWQNVDWQKIRETEYRRKLEHHLSPFLNTMQYDNKDQLEKCWKDVCEKFFSLNCECPTQEQLLTQGYVLLDFHPLFRERLKKNKNTLDNIIRDGNHIYYASEAEYFISEDKNTRKKTEFIYKAFHIATQVVSMEEFVKKIEEIECNRGPLCL